jgi:hypothetical protein
VLIRRKNSEFYLKMKRNKKYIKNNYGKTMLIHALLLNLVFKKRIKIIEI